MADRFTFFRSYWLYAKCLPDAASRAEFFEVLCSYALDGIEPSEDSRHYGAFALVKPTVDKSAIRAEAGAKGGSKPQAKRKQKESKAETNGKQSGSKAVANTEQTASDKDIGVGIGEGKGVGVGGVSPVDGVPLKKLLPTRQEMAMAAHGHNISNEELERFYSEMEERGWSYISQGKLVEVRRKNFSTCLWSWVRRQRIIDEEARAKGSATTTPVYQEEGYDGSELA